MKVRKIVEKNTEIVHIDSDETLIYDTQSALDLIATVSYQTGCDRVMIKKSAIVEDFFDLKTKLAGEILQKFTTYQMKLAIIGDFSVYPSKSLKDFIYECNKGNHIYFIDNEQEAIDKLTK